MKKRKIFSCKLLEQFMLHKTWITLSSSFPYIIMIILFLPVFSYRWEIVLMDQSFRKITWKSENWKSNFLFKFGKLKNIFHSITFLFFHALYISGVANPRPRKKFLRPKLESRLSDFSIFWVYFFSFLLLSGPKSQFSKLRPRDQFGLATPGIYIWRKKPWSLFENQGICRAFVTRKGGGGTEKLKNRVT